MNNNLKPPFNQISALAKVKAAENAWNSKDPKRVSLGFLRTQRRFGLGFRSIYDAFCHESLW